MNFLTEQIVLFHSELRLNTLRIKKSNKTGFIRSIDILRYDSVMAECYFFCHNAFSHVDDTNVVSSPLFLHSFENEIRKFMTFLLFSFYHSLQSIFHTAIQY